MNERIGKLAVEAGAHWDHGDWNMPSAVYFSERDLEKFAELIVRECIELAMNEKLRYSSSYNKEADWAKQLMMLHCAASMDNYKILLREHFGVKE
jgi:hypothetical protein